MLEPPVVSPDVEVKYDNSGRVYADTDALIERELVRIRQRILARKALKANAAGAAAGTNGDRPK
jgi:hypothetical protein